MSVFSNMLGLAFVLAALCPAGRIAHAQAAPVPYWTPGWPLGFGSPAFGQDSNAQAWSTYGNFPSFDGRAARSGFSSMRYDFSYGGSSGSDGGGKGLSMNVTNGDVALGSFSSLNYQGVQFGYNFRNAPVTVFGGFSAANYKSGIGNPFSPFDSKSDAGTAFSANAGVEFQPVPNLSLSLGVGYTQLPERSLSGAYPFAVGPLR